VGFTGSKVRKSPVWSEQRAKGTVLQQEECVRVGFRASGGYKGPDWDSRGVKGTFLGQ
jgi:hypothetical protein